MVRDRVYGAMPNGRTKVPPQKEYNSSGHQTWKYHTGQQRICQNYWFGNRTILEILKFALDKRHSRIHGALSLAQTESLFWRRLLCSRSHSLWTVSRQEALLRKGQEDYSLGNACSLSKNPCPFNRSSILKLPWLYKSSNNIMIKLLQRVPKKRLGYNGLGEIFNHPWLTSPAY